MTYLFIFLIPLVNFFIFEAFFLRPKLFYAALIVSSFLFLLAVKKITGKKTKDKEFWNFSILPILFSGSVAAYSLLITNHFFVHLLFLLNFAFSFYYLKNIYQGKQGEFLENISSYGNFLIVFFSFSVIYGLKTFLNVPVWILISVAAVVMILIISQIFWANKVTSRSNTIFIFIACLILTQLAWVLYFLPFNYNALGLILAICYYVLIGMIKLCLSEKLTARNIKLYLISGLSGIFLILLTAKWI
jgi:hypothetical protein